MAKLMPFECRGKNSCLFASRIRPRAFGCRRGDSRRCLDPYIGDGQYRKFVCIQNTLEERMKKKEKKKVEKKKAEKAKVKKKVEKKKEKKKKKGKKK